MNTEYVAWFVILVAVGVAVVGYLALGPVPEIPAAESGDGPGVPELAAVDRVVPSASASDATPASGSTRAAATAASDTRGHSSPVSTTEPGPSAPSGTSEIP